MHFLYSRYYMYRAVRSVLVFYHLVIDVAMFQLCLAVVTVNPVCLLFV